MTRSGIAVAIIGLLAIGGSAGAQTTTVYDNGIAHGLGSVGLVTHPGAGPGGFDISQRPNGPVPGDVLFGSGIQGGINGAADRFTVPAGQSITFNTVTVYAYVTGLYSVPPVSPITNLNLSILGGAPSADLFPYAPAPDVLAQGIYTPGHGLQSTFSGIWRTPFGNTTSTVRPIFAITARIPELTLGEGDYWLAYSGKGTAPSTSGSGNSFSIFSPFLTGVSGGDPFYPDGVAVRLDGSWTTFSTGTAANGANFPFQLLQTVTPEPSPALLLLPGLGGLLLTLRRRRR